ncbi:O-antigen polysaccharide polymerase Wzy [Pradoshia sp. D12]|uniref:O-antigen polysaccharide polymerase Wzy n=1 Tax=Bacillaceae TaxID=186817 RepID=UPI00112B65F9|nr:MULTISPECIES: O-antigen polysaccharide polymerase Wzy [Bacillaceae]QFK72923.1 O-antigen polysaccharide polymerase Wzy [Pradoshia sp. D12]TPF71915.1 O-antigen polysaccharide polymerase Wzy [Bacillus sp. D12]
MDILRKSKSLRNIANEKVLLILLNVFINLLIMILVTYIHVIPFDEWVFPFALLVLFQFLFNVITVAILERTFLSLTILFMIFSYITHLGISIIFGFNINVDLPWNPLLSITENTFKDASSYSIYCHAFLTFGMCLILFKRKKYEFSYDVIKIKDQLHVVRSIGTILILIGIFPMLYIDINKVLLYINGNYLDTYNVGTYGFIGIIANFTQIGAIMLLIGNKDNKKVNLILFIIVIYQVIFMLTGNRGRPTMYLITILFIYLKIIKRMGLKQMIIIFVLVYLSGFALTFIGQIRMLSINNISVLGEMASNSFKEYSLFNILAEFGGSIITLGHSIDIFQVTKDYQYGTNYLAGLFTVIPNIGGILDSIIPKTVYVNNWPNHIKVFLGGSYLGEVFYSFGKFGYIFVGFIGMFIALISNKIQKCILKQEYVSLSIYLILVPSLLWWTRAYFVDGVREFIWVSTMIWVLNRLVKKKSRYSG